MFSNERYYVCDEHLCIQSHFYYYYYSIRFYHIYLFALSMTRQRQTVTNLSRCSPRKHEQNAGPEIAGSYRIQ